MGGSAAGGGLEAGIGFHQAPHFLGGRAFGQEASQAGPELFLLAGETFCFRYFSFAGVVPSRANIVL